MYYSAVYALHSLSLHDALPIYDGADVEVAGGPAVAAPADARPKRVVDVGVAERAGDPDAAQLLARGIEETAHRSEEHTSELQSPCNLVCRLLLEKKNNISILSV